MDQCSLEWFENRLGSITSTAAGKIMNGGYKQWMKIAQDMERDIQLGAQHFVDNPLNVPAINWGNAHEDEARRAFELIYDCDVFEVGMVFHPEHDYLRASTDGLVFENFFCGPIEIKCPYNPANHENTLVHGMPGIYKPQVQFEMAVCEASEAMFISYDPRHQDPAKRLICLLQRPDEGYIDNMLRKCHEFWEFYQSGEWMLDQPEVPNLF